MTREVSDLDLDRYRIFLRLLAQKQIDPRLRGKFDSSDVVQQAMLQAHQSRGQFRGETEAERVAWLRQILANCLNNALRDFTRDKRDVTREWPIQDALDQSSASVAEWLAAEQDSPSQEAEKHEDLLRLAGALEQLREDQREALFQYYWEDLSMAQIGEKMGRSQAAVAGLIKRGQKQIKQLLDDGGPGDE